MKRILTFVFGTYEKLHEIGEMDSDVEYVCVTDNENLKSNTFTRDGYNFGGWNTKSDGTGTSYQPGATYSGNTSVTLYAIWKFVISNVSMKAVQLKLVPP